jgi:microcystin-dependent protein
MSQPFIGEIRMFGGNFAPVGWMFCAGQLISIPDNETLFNLIGTTYGGDGQDTFGLPNLCGRIPIGMGNGQGLSPRTIGESGGVENVTLNQQQMAQHNHLFMCTPSTATTQTPTSQTALGNTTPLIYSPQGTGRGFDPQPFNPGTIAVTGGGQPHENRGPYLCVSFIISLYGIYPPQS